MGRLTGYLDSRRFDRALARWDRLATSAARLGAAELRALRSRARAMGHAVDRARVAAEGALIAAAPSPDVADVPEQSDWVWRPDQWRLPLARPGAVAVGSPHPVGAGISLFHDCAVSELSILQHRNAAPDIPAPFAISLDVYRFDGSFLSLVLDCPDAALKGLTRNYVLEAVLSVSVETPLEIYGRLNVEFGPNSDQLVREMPIYDGTARAEFDLAYSSINERRLEKMWLDLIFEGPKMNRVTLHDVVLSRRPRADL